MGFSILCLTITCLTSLFVGATVSRYLTAKEWSRYCAQTSSRWHEYVKRLIEDDVKRMGDDHFE